MSVTLLSSREAETAHLFALGHGASAIAGLMGVTVKTVNSYKEHIRAKLGIETAMQWMKFLRTLPGPE